MLICPLIYYLQKIKKMKKITKILCLGILFLFAFSWQLSAQKCKYDYDRADPITGEASKGNTCTIQTYGMGFPIWQVGFNKMGDSYFIGNMYRLVGNVREVIQKGDQMFIKLSNGELITLVAQDDFLPIAKATQSGVYTEYLSKYAIDAATLQKIADNQPTFIRMNIESKTYEKEISSGDGKKMAQAAKCILQ